MVARLSSEDLPNVFTEMNVNSFGGARSYLTLVYLINVSEDTEREAVRLVTVTMKDMNITRVEEGFFQRVTDRIRRVFTW